MTQENGRSVLRKFGGATDYQECGFGELLALRDCVASCGVNADWHDILGFSGDAFGCDNMDYPAARVHDPVLTAARAYGFSVAGWAFGREHGLDDLQSEIDAGRPVVVGAGQFSVELRVVCWHFLAVGGYDTANDRLLVSGAGQEASWVPVPREDGVRGLWNGQCPWATGAPREKGLRSNWHGCPRFLLGERQEPPPLAASFVKALRAGVASYRRAALETWAKEKRRDVFGREYLATWPEKLQKWSERIQKQPIDENDGDPPATGYFNPIAVSVRRRAAAAFLRKHAAELPALVHPHIEAAAMQYEKSADTADQIFRALYTVDELDKLDWHGKLLSVRWYIGEGSGMAKAVSDYAKAHPDRWAIRTRVIKRVNESLTDDASIQKACRLVGDILKSDDAAIAEIEKALAATK